MQLPETHRLTPSRLATLSARTVFRAFLSYKEQFKTITLRAKLRFETRNWQGMQADARERLLLYRLIVDQTEADIRALLADRVLEKLVWVSMKAVYSGLIDEHDDWELGETFFNSITRRIFDTVGVDPRVEFVDTDFDDPPTHAHTLVYRTFQHPTSLPALMEAILGSYRFQVPYQDLQHISETMADRIAEHLASLNPGGQIERAEMVDAVFYRGMGAYLVGRLFSRAQQIPLAIALLHTEEGLQVDAVLLDENDISILFSFAHSYFHVQTDRPYDLVRFLTTIIPRKRIAELYISIGHNKHGKTELYRDLLHHLHTSTDTFEVARGKLGLVMAVFTLPTYDVVFKVIKDQFGPPKNTTRQSIMEKYELVFKHDRAGRLVDAQSFEYLTFNRRLFSDELLQNLLDIAGKTVRLEGDTVVVDHAYVERRVIPLDLYAREAEAAAARHAVVDYGLAIKDLAASNIFPGDLLLKNFGVTRHGRVVFYDYDELALVTSCNFRTMPVANSYEDEWAAEPWFYVGENDIFPEEFARFLGLPEDLRKVFIEAHGDLFEATFWLEAQQRIQDEQMIPILPYASSCRL